MRPHSDRQGAAQLAWQMTSAESAVVYSCLRAYLARIHAYMMLGLSITGFAALVTYRLALAGGLAEGGEDLTLTALGHAVVEGPLKWPVVLAPIVFAVLLRWRLARMNTNASEIAFGVYAALVGMSLASIFLIFAAKPVVQVFFVSAAAFGALSLWTRLTGQMPSWLTSFMVIGLAGAGIAALLAGLLRSAPLESAVCMLGVLALAGLAAWDTGRLKAEYLSGALADAPAERAAIVGALSLYLKFISLFIALAQIVGGRNH